MAFYYLLKALDLSPGSEVIFPALTFWVVPEMARVLGLKPVFVDVNPDTFNLDPEALERAVTDDTRVVVPTHLYGLPCDLDRVLEIADRRRLFVIEDCAHSLGALYRGRPVGTLGDAAFFSFQTLKPLNTYGGGMAVVRDPALARKVAALVRAEPWPSESEVRRKLLTGRVQRIMVRPSVFRWTLFPLLWVASFFRARPDVYLWEAIRPLDPLPPDYRRRYSNVQAALGLAGLRHLPQWTAATCRHAELLSAAMSRLPAVRLPVVPPDRTHVFYQYCLRVPDRDRLVRACIRRGLDIETLHVDVCPQLPLFQPYGAPCPGAVRAAQAVQLPAYSSLSEDEVRWISDTVTAALRHTFAAAAPVAHRARP
jgi:dTDP-4-amino-4,6-dideoxygalactose transaminase